MYNLNVIWRQISDPSSRSSYSRVSRGPPPNNQIGGGVERNEGLVRIMTWKPFWIASKPRCIEKGPRLKCTSKRGSQGEAGTWWYQGVIRTSGTDLGLEHSVVVLRTVCRWPAFDPLFFSGERPNSEIRTIVLS